MLAFVVFWTYIVFFQAFIVWIANRPEEVEWYLHRLEGGWWIVAIVIGIGHSLVPFLVLLSYRIKRSPRALAVIAGGLLVVHVVDMHWKTVPARPHAVVVHWSDLGALAFVVGGCAAFVAWRLAGRRVAPRFDRALGKGTRYHSD
jgi:hypothetical protein